MKLYTLCLPTDKLERGESLLRRIAEKIGGYTLVPGGSGCWVDPRGVNVNDPITLLLALADESTSTYFFFAGLVKLFEDLLGEEEIFAYSVDATRILPITPGLEL